MDKPKLKTITTETGEDFVLANPDENSTITQPRRKPPTTAVDHLLNSFRKLPFPQKQKFINSLKAYF